MSIEAQGAERAILSILMKEPTKYYEISDVLFEADFVNTGAALIYRVLSGIILAGAESRIGKHLVLSVAERENIESFYYHTLNGDLVEAIEGQNVNPANLKDFVKSVKFAAIKRALINTCEDVKEDVEEFAGDAVELRNTVENRILSSLRAIDTGQEEIESIADNFQETIHEFANMSGPMGIDIGMPRWQEDIGHIRNGAITGLFASTKVGKSQFAMWSAFMTAIQERKPVLYLDTELQLRQQQMRLCGIMTGIPYNIIEAGRWKSDKSMIAKIDAACKLIGGAPIYYKNIAGKSVHNVIPIIRKFVYQHMGGRVEGDEGRGLVVYDYIKLMSSTDIDKMQEYQLIGLLMSHLHDLVADLNIPLITLGQLNKQEDIGIRRIVENVDSATVLRPKTEDEMREDGLDRGSHVLQTKWARHGIGHSYNEWVNVKFDKSCGQFKEDKRNSEVMTAVKRVKADIQRQDTTGLVNISENF